MKFGEFRAAPIDPAGAGVAAQQLLWRLRPVFGRFTPRVIRGCPIDACAGFVSKPSERGFIAPPLKSGQLKISAAVDLQSHSAERAVSTVSFDKLAHDVQNGGLHAWVERIVIRGQSAV